MGVSKQQAVENRRAIVAAAEKLFRERGVDAVGLTELMKSAGFTQGGFYNHFRSKEALVAAVMDKAIEDRNAAVAEAAEVALDERIRRYLSVEHRANIDAGCPVAGFAGDARRLGSDARESYAKGLAQHLQRFAGAIEARDGKENRGKAIGLFSQMIGTLLLSRAVADIDPALADEILQEGREHLLAALDDA